MPARGMNGATATRGRTNDAMTNGNGKTNGRGRASARPLVRQRSPELQAYGTISPLPNGLDQNKLKPIVDQLNQLLADTMTLADLYKKHHWQVAGPTFYQLHLLFDKHYDEQVEL